MRRATLLGWAFGFGWSVGAMYWLYVLMVHFAHLPAVLGVLGIVFVLMVVYAGYLYMTDMGHGEKAKQAKKLIGQAVIGIVIIVLAYAISTFVISQIISASTTT